MALEITSNIERWVLSETCIIDKPSLQVLCTKKLLENHFECLPTLLGGGGRADKIIVSYSVEKNRFSCTCLSARRPFAVAVAQQVLYRLRFIMAFFPTLSTFPSRRFVFVPVRGAAHRTYIRNIAKRVHDESTTGTGNGEMAGFRRIDSSSSAWNAINI